MNLERAVYVLAGFAVGAWTSWAIFSLSYGRGGPLIAALVVVTIATISGMACTHWYRAANAWRAAYLHQRAITPREARHPSSQAGDS